MDTIPDNSLEFNGYIDDLKSKGIEVGMASATALSVVGTSVGFILYLGPIFWGLASGLIGFLLGFGLYFLFKKSKSRNLPQILPEILVIVQCTEQQSRSISEIFWKYRALTVGRTQQGSKLED